MPSGHFPGFSGVQRGTAGAVEEARLPDPRPAATRAQEVRPKGRPQAVPVLQTLNPREGWKAVGLPSGPCYLSTNRNPALVRRVNLALDRAACDREHVNFRSYFACNLNEGVARSWRSLRAPDQALPP